MEILTWILFGALFGMIAHALDPKHTKEEIFGAMLVGGIGAFNGGIVAKMLFDGSYSGLHVSSVVIMMVSIFALLLVGRMLKNLR